MRRPLSRGLVLLFSCVGAACSAEPAPPPGARLDLQVGALSLPGVGRVCYDVRVENGAGQLVWSKGTVGTRANQGDSGALCSDRYGNTTGGDVTYVGPCDATEPQHTVRLWIDSIEDEGGVALSDWRDPCPAGPGDAPGGCVKTVSCSPNRDTLVAYDLTVMRQANQGFFDVAVNFDDIFCSAKLDCTYDDAGQDPIRLLHREGVRSQTAVIGFACTGGPGGAGTMLHASDIRVDCGAGGGGSLEVQVAFGALEDGTVFGFEVHGAQSGPPTIVPTLWERTAAGTWATGQALPTGTMNSANLIWRLGPDRIAGPNFDTTNPGAPNIAIWSRVGGVWGLERSESIVAGATDLAEYDASRDRLWLGDAFEGAIYAHWNITGLNLGVHAIPDASGEACAVLEVAADVAVARCGGAPYLYNPVTLALTGLPWPLGVTEGVLVDAEVMADGAILGLVDATGNGGQKVLTRWAFVEGNWTPQTIVSDSDLTFDWSSQGYVSVTNGAGVQTLYRADFSGNVESWSSASLDGNTTYRLNGLVVHGAEVVVMGAAERDGVMVPVAGLLGMAGDEITLVELPLGVPVANIQAVFALGLDASNNLLIVGGDPATLRDVRILSGVDTALWAVSTAGELSVVDHRVLTSANATITSYSQQTHLPLRPTPVVAGFVADESFGLAGYAGAWEPFMGGTSDELAVPPVRLMSPLAGSASTSLDPTVLGNGWTTDPDPNDAVWGYAIYRGTEALQCGLASCDKVYWNAAIGFDTTFPNCTIHFEATAADAPGLTLGQTPTNGRYPVLVYDVQLTDADSMVCRRNGLDDGGGVASTYTAPDTSTTFCFAFDGETTSVSPLCEGEAL